MRILVIGDSYVEAIQVPQEKHFGRLLESKLPNTEVILMARGGYGTKREKELLRDGLKFAPDVVVVVWCNND
ncbi:MAG TPA: SGNH/GDSL hydrolase family protein, partial [Acidobacteriota bacterium]|nr:SGNH/GDSL hydrolase family protein [Acidobacteriota bacterium]